MSKAALIRKLDAEGLSSREIQKRAKCSDVYVRVVLRQRGHCGASVYDINYRASIYELGDREAARVACRQAYRRARAEGLEIAKATSLAGHAYSATMEATGRAARKKERRNVEVRSD